MRRNKITKTIFDDLYGNNVYDKLIVQRYFQNYWALKNVVIFERPSVEKDDFEKL